MKSSSFAMLRPVYLFVFLNAGTPMQQQKELMGCCCRLLYRLRLWSHTLVILIQAIAMLVAPSLLFPHWFTKIKHFKREVEREAANSHSLLISNVQNMEKVFLSMSSVGSNLAKLMNSSLPGDKISVSDVQTKVQPVMFKALLNVPYLSQISYVGLDGLFFSYFINRNQIVAHYSSSSFSSNSSSSNADSKNSWYQQLVNPVTGELFGCVVAIPSHDVKNAGWFREALNASELHASLEAGWNQDQGLLLLNTAKVNARSALSLGFSVKQINGIFSGINLDGGSLYLASEDGKVLLGGLPNTNLVFANASVSIGILKRDGNTTNQFIHICCEACNGSSGASTMVLENVKYLLYCSPITILNKKLVYVLAAPEKPVIELLQAVIKLAIILIILLIAILVVTISIFIVCIIRSSRREMHLCASLINQMEATRQAESKSMSKTNAFATASHDIRASLAGIIGLIHLSNHDTASCHEIDTNLKQMEACAKDLLGLLSSILDTSKIEAGKMLLEEEEFNLVHFLEYAADLYHPVAMEKGVDLVLDLCDGSVVKTPLVKGDRGKLNQVICNLLSNAVKFTDEGHVLVRAWMRKPSFENSIIASGQGGWWKHLPCLYHEKNGEDDDVHPKNVFQHNPNLVEVVIEVDDTGKGIPKEKQKSVFENYIQVKETAQGKEGTGLGLGIVQSLVRLMGGEIKIVDKEIGEKGTCFRFNVFLTTCDNISEIRSRDGSNDFGNISGPSSMHHMGLSICTSPKLSISTPSPRFACSSRREGSHVILLMQSEERRRTIETFFQTHGIKVSAIKKWQDLTRFGIMLRRKVSHQSASGKSDLSLRSESSGKSLSNNSSRGLRGSPVSAKDEPDQILPVHRKTSYSGQSNFFLLVIDTRVGPFPDVLRAVSSFRKGLDSACCKVVWLDNPITRIVSRIKHDNRFDASDEIISKPLHGTRLLELMKLLPEFGSCVKESPKKPNREHSYKANVVSEVPTLETSTPSYEKPLHGKKVLVAEDSLVARMVARKTLLLLGATVELCVNGKDAIESVKNGLARNREIGSSNPLPYDYILMDCEMDVMDGYEATRRIREEEKEYGIHIPIIALTAHTEGIEVKNAQLAGMDLHLQKPLDREHLMEAIRRFG